MKSALFVLAILPALLAMTNAGTCEIYTAIIKDTDGFIKEDPAATQDQITTFATDGCKDYSWFFKGFPDVCASLIKSNIQAIVDALKKGTAPAVIAGAQVLKAC